MADKTFTLTDSQMTDIRQALATYSHTTIKPMIEMTTGNDKKYYMERQADLQELFDLFVLTQFSPARN